MNIPTPQGHEVIAARNATRSLPPHARRMLRHATAGIADIHAQGKVSLHLPLNPGPRPEPAPENESRPLE